MTVARWIVVVGLVTVVGAGTALAKPRHGGPAMPQFSGAWHPEVGAGAVYQVEAKGQPSTTWEIAVVGEEAGAHWVEMSFDSEEGPMTTKTLVNPSGMKRMIMKMGQQPAMEMPVMASRQNVKTDVEKSGERVGTESVSTPAGTFTTEHYRSTVEGKPVDVWISKDVSPYGLVKWTSPEMSMVLAKRVTGAKTRIAETPQQMPDMGQMMQSIMAGQQGGMPAMPAAHGNDEQ